MQLYRIKVYNFRNNRTIYMPQKLVDLKIFKFYYNMLRLGYNIMSTESHNQALNYIQYDYQENLKLKRKDSIFIVDLSDKDIQGHY